MLYTCAQNRAKNLHFSNFFYCVLLKFYFSVENSGFVACSFANHKMHVGYVVPFVFT